MAISLSAAPHPCKISFKRPTHIPTPAAVQAVLAHPVVCVRRQGKRVQRDDQTLDFTVIRPASAAQNQAASRPLTHEKGPCSLESGRSRIACRYDGPSKERYPKNIKTGFAIAARRFGTGHGMASGNGSGAKLRKCPTATCKWIWKGNDVLCPDARFPSPIGSVVRNVLQRNG
jgi:hypothetical protein